MVDTLTMILMVGGIFAWCYLPFWYISMCYKHTISTDQAMGLLVGWICATLYTMFNA